MAYLHKEVRVITYALVVVDGCIHSSHMEVQLGTEHFEICCSALRRLIQRANKIGIYQLLENLNPNDREMFAMLYEEFRDKI